MLNLSRSFRALVAVCSITVQLGCVAQRRADEGLGKPPEATELPSCQSAWAQLPATDRSYQLDRDGLSTPLGNQGYQSYRARVAREQCQKEWTVLVYMAADAKDLHRPALQTLRSIEQGGLPADAEVDLVTQLDLFTQPGIRRLHVLGLAGAGTKSSDSGSEDPAQLRSPIVEYQADETTLPQQSLTEFLRWGVRNYPARRYMVVLWGHGLGWRPRPASPSRLNYDPANPLGGIALDESQLTVLDIPAVHDSLRTVSTERLGGRPFDVLATDACLMQSVEVTTELADTARFFVGSEAKFDYEGLPYPAILGMMDKRADLEIPAAPSSRCVAGDTACALALRLPTLSLQQPPPVTGAAQRGPNFVLSVVDLPRLTSALVPSLQTLGQALKEYLREDPTRAVAIRNLLAVRTGMQMGLSRAIPDFPGGTRDLGIFLLNLRTIIRRESERSDGASSRAVLTAIEQAEGALTASILSLAAGTRYDEERYRGLAGLSTWLPSTDDEWNSRRDFFVPARFFQPASTSTSTTSSWEGWLAALFLTN